MKSRCLWICSTALLLVSTGCFGVDDQSCEYWVEQFEGQYGNKEAAIKNIGRLKCADASEPLKKHFPNSLYRRDILAAAKAIGMNTHTVALVESALRDRDIGAVAIRIALEWNVSDIKSQLSSMIRSQETAQIRQQALEAMMELTSPPKVVIGKGPKDPGAVLYTGRPARNEINVYVQHVQDPTTGVLVRGGTVLIKGDYKAGVTAKAVADLINAHEEATKLILAEAGGDGSGKVAANRWSGTSGAARPSTPWCGWWAKSRPCRGSKPTSTRPPCWTRSTGAASRTTS